eukprot:TRINITY_DN13234_c0_g1_i1.p1 TRINITY_DN13234_c0_g1~~TRINITY_DN13234_c0_g1_i1.p1  ORF type:complete len:131 (-),score=20.52 TRINITY_DN13234_c0_g1_i1:32-382(-)
MGTKKLQHAAICGLDGNIWAKSNGFNASPQEVQNIIRGFKNNQTLKTHGMNVNNQHYWLMHQNEERTIVARKETKGLHCTKTGKCVLLACYDKPYSPGQVSVIVEKLADYLVGVGY